MARTSLTPKAVLGNKASSYTANAADLTVTAADVANKNQAAIAGRLMLFCYNSGGSPYTVTVTSVAEERFGRTGDITTYSIGAGEYAILGPFGRPGWGQSDGKLYFEASNAAVLIGVIKVV